VIPTVVFILAFAEPELDDDIVIIDEYSDETYEELETSSELLMGEPATRCYRDDWWHASLRAAPRLTPWRRDGGTLHSTTVEAVTGFQVRRTGLDVLGRAWVGPRRTNGGAGGLRGSVDVVHRARFRLATELAVTVGGGRDEGGPARLVVAVEPGVRALVRTRGGSFGAALTWYQPFAVNRRWVGALVPSAIWRVLEF